MPSAKSLAAKLREKRKRGFQEPEEAVNEAADPTYFGAALPYLDDEVLDAINTAPLTVVFALNTGANPGLCDQTSTTQLQPDSKKSLQNVQAFCAAQSSSTSEDAVVMGDGLDLDPDLEVRELTYLLNMY